MCDGGCESNFEKIVEVVCGRLKMYTSLQKWLNVIQKKILFREFEIGVSVLLL
jgi:hypothetical protein